LGRRKNKRKKRPPLPVDPVRVEAAEKRLARLREEVRPELLRIEAEARRTREPLVPLDVGKWRPGLGHRLRLYWRKQLNELALRLAFRRMRKRRLAPQSVAPAVRRFQSALDRFLRDLKKLEKEAANGVPRFLADAELFLDDLRSEVEQARLAADRWEDWARQAVLAGRDDLARQALTVRDQWQRQADDWQSKLESSRASVARLERRI
jgi:hypothetical protein